VAAPAAKLTNVSAPVKAPPAASSAAPGWYVQVGSFSDAGKASTILGLLGNAGFKGEVTSVQTAAGATLYRVRLGRYDNEAAAKQTLALVSHQGYPTARVVHEGK